MVLSSLFGNHSNVLRHVFFNAWIILYIGKQSLLKSVQQEGGHEGLVRGVWGNKTLAVTLSKASSLAWSLLVAVGTLMRMSACSCRL